MPEGWKWMDAAPASGESEGSQPQGDGRCERFGGELA